MKLFIGDTYESMSKEAADDVFGEVQSLSSPLLCTASGDSPAEMYRELTKLVNQKNKDISRWYFVGLDEWLGMNGNDEGSCRFHLNNQLFNPLNVAGSKLCFFDGRANDLQRECNRIENFINSNGGIDIAIVGLGMNGHVGMNEPGTSAVLHSHVADIDPDTQQTGQKYFKGKTSLSKGITLGIANLMEAGHVILLVNGNKKAEIVREILEGEISEQFPASLLRNHKNFSVYLDAGAASLLQTK